jgi:NADH-ubiquinone oxidoreductase chain 5
MNRVGDMGLSIGFLALFTLFGSLDYSSIFSLTPFLNETSVTVIGLLLLIGAMAKSAQIPLHSWLPGSMEGPTPVSALIHAAKLLKFVLLSSSNKIISIFKILNYLLKLVTSKFLINLNINV